jgi:hypothetical protein
MTPDQWALVWTVALVAPVLFTMGYLWGRWHESRKKRWSISFESAHDVLTIRSIRRHP